MKTKIIIISILTLFFSKWTIGQDTVIFINSDIKLAKITEVNQTSIKYYHFSNLNGPLYVSNKNEIYKIKYSNGQIDSFTLKPSLIVDIIKPKKKSALKIFIGGGLGLGYASCSKGQARTLYSGDFSVIYKYFIGTFRYIKGEEMRVSWPTGGWLPPLFPNFDTDSPRETTQESALLLGVNFSTQKFLFNAAIGLSFQDNINRGKYLGGFYPSYERVVTKNTYGFPFEAQITRYYKCFGFGLKFYFNTNKILNTSGILFSIKLGLFKY